MSKQHTLAKSVQFTGIGVHTGSRTKMTFIPAPANTGICFVRTDVEGSPVIPAHIRNVVDITRGTTIGREGVNVHTVEHILAALYGMGIDNLRIELDAMEPPVGDGSSLPYVNLIREVGLQEQDAERTELVITEPIWIRESGMLMMALPSDRLTISCTISYRHAVLDSQYASVDIDPQNFEQMISPSRTFCFYHEVESLIDKGLIKGGSLENAIVIGDDAILSKEELRFKDEFVRHKILDILGDMYLLGKRLRGHIVAVKSGHAVNIKFAERIYQALVAVPAKTPAAVPAAAPHPAPELRKILDINQILSILPHRYPFLLVDRIVEFEERKRIVGIKNVTMNEPFFQGHFPGHPIMPGVLILEAMAQIGGVLCLQPEANRGKLAYFMSIDKAKFRKPVFPGDQLRIELTVLNLKSRNGKFKGEAYVGTELVTEGEIMFSLVDRN